MSYLLLPKIIESLACFLDERDLLLLRTTCKSVKNTVHNLILNRPTQNLDIPKLSLFQLSCMSIDEFCLSFNLRDHSAPTKLFIMAAVSTIGVVRFDNWQSKICR